MQAKKKMKTDTAWGQSQIYQKHFWSLTKELRTAKTHFDN